MYAVVKQLLPLAAALLFIGTATVVQYRTSAPSPAEVPVEWDLDKSKMYAAASFTDLVLHQKHPTPPELDTLSEQEVLRHLGRLYSYQSNILAAEADGDNERLEQLLDEAMRELNKLMRHPYVADRPRFRELYRSLATEYESHYGVPDTTRLPESHFYKARADMFDAVGSVEPAPSLAEVQPEGLQPRTTEVPLPYNDLVQSALTYLQRSPEDHVYRWMRRKETYFPMIEHIFAEEGVPDELKYLALVESGLKPTTESWASAAGLWQFMPTTGRAYGLSITPWVDERLDPEKATRAAARHLKDLYRLFDGDWLLALSGYNCSPTVIRKAMRKARQRLGREPTFWDIYKDIPQETRNYVPTFVAAALMISNPSTFGLKRVKPGPRYHFDYVPVKGMLSLKKVAELAGTSVDRIRALNPELRRATLPPSKEPYYVRLPYGTYDQFTERYEKLPENQKGLLHTYTVKSNDTLEKIAERFDVTASRIVELNNLQHAMLRTGQQLALPEPSYEGNAQLVARAGAEPISVRYSSRTTRPLAATGRRGSALSGERLVMHRVKEGDTLSDIADRYGVSTNQILQWNDLRSDRVDVGQRLKIYG